MTEDIKQKIPLLHTFELEPEPDLYPIPYSKTLQSTVLWKYSIEGFKNLIDKQLEYELLFNDLFPDSVEDVKAISRDFAQKLMAYLTFRLAQNNSYKRAKDGFINCALVIPLDQLFGVFGIGANRRTRDDFKARCRAICRIMGKTRIKLEGGGNELLVSKWDINRGYFYFTFAYDLARDLLTDFYILLPPEIFKLDERNGLLFHLAVILSSRATQYNNIKNNTHDIIKLSALVDALPGLPSLDDPGVIADRRHSESIEKPLKKALEHLEKKGLITWEYCLAKKEPLPDGFIRDQPFTKWMHKVYIQFTLKNNQAKDKAEVFYKTRIKQLKKKGRNKAIDII